MHTRTLYTASLPVTLTAHTHPSLPPPHTAQPHYPLRLTPRVQPPPNPVHWPALREVPLPPHEVYLYSQAWPRVGQPHAERPPEKP